MNTNKWEILGASVAAVLSGVLIFFWLAGAYDRGELVPVVASGADTNEPQMLVAGALTLVKIPRASVPEGARYNVADLVGAVATRPLKANQIILPGDITAGRDQSSESLLVPVGLVGLVLPHSWLSSPLPRLKPRDLVTIYVATPLTKEGLGASGEAVKNAEVLAVRADKDGAPSAVFVAVRPEDAKRLLQLKASQLPLMALLESGANEAY